MYAALLFIAAILRTKNRKKIEDEKPQLIGQGTKSYIVKTHD